MIVADTTHPRLPGKLIFFLKDNSSITPSVKISGIFFLSYVLHLMWTTCASSTSNMRICLHSLHCYRCLPACASVLLSAAHGSFYEMFVQWKEIKTNNAFCCVTIWQINCEDSRFSSSLLVFWLHRFLTFCMNSNWKWLLMIYPSN